MSDFVLTPKREKELEKIAQDLPDKSFKSLYGKDWKSVKMATAMNILKKKYGFKTEETKMKFKEIREKINKMAGSKLTGPEISVYYRKNPGAKKASRDPKVKKAIEFALDHGGAMTFAIKNIEKMKRGLASHPEVAKALEFANFGEAVVKETLEEGTWRIPETNKQLKQLVDLLAKPYPATTPKDVEKFQDKLPIGDDKLYDDLESVFYEKGTGAGGLKRPLVIMKKFPKVFLNVIAGESLAKRIDNWIDGRVQGNKYIATHHFFDDLSVLEKAPGRKSGNLKPLRKVKI